MRLIAFPGIRLLRARQGVFPGETIPGNTIGDQKTRIHACLAQEPCQEHVVYCSGGVWFVNGGLGLFYTDAVCWPLADRWSPIDTDTHGVYSILSSPYRLLGIRLRPRRDICCCRAGGREVSCVQGSTSGCPFSSSVKSGSSLAAFLAAVDPFFVFPCEHGTFSICSLRQRFAEYNPISRHTGSAYLPFLRLLCAIVLLPETAFFLPFLLVLSGACSFDKGALISARVGTWSRYGMLATCIQVR